MKDTWPDFAAMRQLAMRFRGIMRSGDLDKLTLWINDGRHCGLHAMQRFARSLQQDIEAVRNAMTEPWSNGQAEGQINRLKTLKRSMYGRAGVELLRARFDPASATQFLITHKPQPVLEADRALEWFERQPR
jgi:transposase